MTTSFGEATGKRRSNEIIYTTVNETSDEVEELTTSLAAMKTSLLKNKKLKERILERSNVIDKESISVKDEIEFTLEPSETSLYEKGFKDKNIKLKEESIKMPSITKIIEGNGHGILSDLLDEENFLSVSRLMNHYCRVL